MTSYPASDPAASHQHRPRPASGPRPAPLCPTAPPMQGAARLIPSRFHPRSQASSSHQIEFKSIKPGAKRLHGRSFLTSSVSYTVIVGVTGVFRVAYTGTSYPSPPPPASRSHHFFGGRVDASWSKEDAGGVGLGNGRG